MKKVLVGAVAIASVIGVGGYFYVASTVQKDAERQVRAFLADNNLLDAISYGDIDTSLFGGSLTINNIRLYGEKQNRGGNDPLTIERVVIDKLNIDDDRLQSIRVQFSNALAPIAAANALLTPTTSGVPIDRYLSVMGSDRLSLDGSVYLNAEPSKGKAELKVDWSGRDFAGVAIEAKFQNLDDRLFRKAGWKDLQEYANVGSSGMGGMLLIGALLDLGKQLGSVEIEEARFQWSDKGIGKHLGDLEKYHLGTIDGAKPGVIPQARLQGVVDELRANGFQTADAEKIAKAGTNWMYQRQNIRLAVTFDQPARISAQLLPILTAAPAERKQHLQRLVTRGRFEAS